MATIQQIQRGLTLFIDNDVCAAFTGWQKAVVGGCGGLIAAGVPSLVKTYCSHPLVAAIGLYDPESETVNLEAVYDAIVPKLGAEKIPVNLPMIGTMRLGKEEFDSLMRYIKGG